MKYLSLFTGIGGFEAAIHKVFPDAECVGYSEIETNAKKVYEHHYPNHKNLGDITKISDEQIKNLINENGCDLVVGGFPCKNLTSVARLNRNGDSSGLKGSQSKLFYELIRILKVVVSVNPEINFVIENNASMNMKSRKIITDTITDLYHSNVYMTKIDSALFGVQTRKRLFWTNFKVPLDDTECIQTWEDVLDDKESVKEWVLSRGYISYFNKIYECKRLRKTKICVPKGEYYKFDILQEDAQYSRWDLGFISDTMSTQLYTPYPLGKARPVLSSAGGNNMVIDRRFGPKGSFLPREFTSSEKEKLFGYPVGYTDQLSSKTQKTKVLGNTVVVPVITHIMGYLLEHLCDVACFL